MRRRPLQLLDVRIPDDKRHGPWAGKSISVLLDYRERPVRIREFYGRGVAVPTEIVAQQVTRRYILAQARTTMDQFR